jgi:beta-glucosidase-like glycosyl hydrolase
MTLEEKVGQLFCVGTYANDVEMEKEHVKQDREKYLEEAIVHWKVGTILFKMFWPYSQLKDTIQKIRAAPTRVTPFFMMDSEWGLGMRCPDVPPLPKALALGSANDIRLTEKWAKMIGRQARSVGITFVTGPVADVNTNPENPVIGDRSFGNDPRIVAQHVRAAIRGFRSEGVACCAKHYTGHGDTDKNSHDELPYVNKTEEELFQTEFIPFQAAIEEGVPAIMTAHICLPKLGMISPECVTISKRAIDGILREKLHFSKIVITDDVWMKGIIDHFSPEEVAQKALLAGADIVLTTEHIERMIPHIILCVKKGIISEDLIDEKVQRILAAKAELIHGEVGLPDTSLLSEEIYSKAFTYLGEHSSIPLHKSRILHIGGKALDVDPQRYMFLADAVTGFRDLQKVRDFCPQVVVIGGLSRFRAEKYKITEELQEFLTKVVSPSMTCVLLGTPYARSFLPPSALHRLLVCFDDTQGSRLALTKMIVGERE